MAERELENLETGARLKWMRKTLGLTQEEFAEKAGLKGNQYQNWESGAASLSISGARALRRTYGLSLDFMYEGIAETLPITLLKAWQDRPDVNASR